MLRIPYLLLPFMTAVLTPAEVGYASRYDPGVMAATIEARQEWGHIPQDLTPWDAFVAVPDCDDIGETVWIWFDGLDTWRRALVSDCARRDDGDGALSWMAQNNILFEVGWPTAAEGDFTCLCSRRAMMTRTQPAFYMLGLTPGG